MADGRINKVRVTSIDFLRGVVMIIMALDHTRDYFHRYSYLHDTTDLHFTSPAIFFTRWITHFCAPVFVFLAGTSAYLSGQRKGKAALASFLFKRGLWLIVVEFTLCGFGWFFNPLFNLFVFQVIWILGLSMVVLAALVRLPMRMILAFGLLLVFGHNLLDNIHVPGDSLAALGWSELHEFHFFHYPSVTIGLGYPVLPWIGVMALGYCLGYLYNPLYSPAERKRMLLMLGFAGVLLFVVLRFTNVYGDPRKWSGQSSPTFTVISFLNTSKYPPSLLYLLMTLSPAFLFLALTEKTRNRLSGVVRTYGRVPLMYYLLHIYVLHVLALMAVAATGFDWRQMIIRRNWVTDQVALKGYGFSLPVVYAVWIGVVVLLYPVCKRYDAYKRGHPEKWWLSYF